MPGNRWLSPTLRYWTKVLVAGLEECWLWTGRKTSGGYGSFSLASKRVPAHQYGYFLEHGRWAPDKVCHSCDNPPCQNPRHLVACTQAENVADMDAKGRRRPVTGEAHGRAVLSDEDVATIRRLAGTGRSKRSLATEFAVSRTQIRRVIEHKQRGL